MTRQDIFILALSAALSVGIMNLGLRAWAERGWRFYDIFLIMAFLTAVWIGMIPFIY